MLAFSVPTYDVAVDTVALLMPEAYTVARLAMEAPIVPVDTVALLRPVHTRMPPVTSTAEPVAVLSMSTNAVWRTSPVREEVTWMSMRAEPLGSTTAKPAWMPRVWVEAATRKAMEAPVPTSWMRKLLKPEVPAVAPLPAKESVEVTVMLMAVPSPMRAEPVLRVTVEMPCARMVEPYRDTMLASTAVRLVIAMMPTAMVPADREEMLAWPAAAMPV